MLKTVENMVTVTESTDKIFHSNTQKIFLA